MTTSEKEYAAVVGRAHRRFPDHKVDVAFQVCLPVYEIRLRVVEMAEHELSTSARFILQLANLDVAQPDELGKLLGLSGKYVVEAAAELLNDGLVAQRPDLGIEITDNGREVLRTGGRSLRPRESAPKSSIRLPNQEDHRHRHEAAVGGKHRSKGWSLRCSRQAASTQIEQSQNRRG